jgi:hypothetical protein
MKKFIFLLFLFVSLVSCKSRQIANTHTIERITEVKKDSTSVKEISKAINDSLFLKIAAIKSAKPECDSLINIEIKNLLKRIESHKKSGDNALGFYFDELNNMLVAYGSMQETMNERVNTLSAKNNSKKDLEVKPIQVKYTPKWIKILAILGGLFLLFLGWRFYRIFT